MDDEALEQAANRFASLDGHRQGFLGPAEFGRLLGAVGGGGVTPSTADVQRSFAAADRNGDARIDFNEFVAYTSSLAAAKGVALSRWLAQIGTALRG